MTGTVLSGSVNVNDVRFSIPVCFVCSLTVFSLLFLLVFPLFLFMRLPICQTIEIPELRVQRKVKSMQMFRKPVDKAVQGDRVGVCVTQLEATALERGLACTPGM